MIRETLDDGVDPEVISSIHGATSHLEELGCTVTEVFVYGFSFPIFLQNVCFPLNFLFGVLPFFKFNLQVSLPSFSLGLPAYYILASSESSSNLSRYDGVR